eukprot:364824-Chlamydomonas_euryale.AAC.5
MPVAARRAHRSLRATYSSASLSLPRSKVACRGHAERRVCQQRQSVTQSNTHVTYATMPRCINQGVYGQLLCSPRSFGAQPRRSKPLTTALRRNTISTCRHERRSKNGQKTPHDYLPEVRRTLLTLSIKQGQYVSSMKRGSQFKQWGCTACRTRIRAAQGSPPAPLARTERTPCRVGAEPAQVDKFRQILEAAPHPA